MFNWNSREKTKVKLEGCLDETSQVKLCKHNIGGVCWFCLTGNEPEEDTDQEEDTDMFESKMFKSKLG